MTVIWFGSGMADILSGSQLVQRHYKATPFVQLSIIDEVLL
jgi:hypothetical protein